MRRGKPTTRRPTTGSRIRWIAAGLSVALGLTACTLPVPARIAPPPEAWRPGRNTHPDSAAFQALLDRYARQGLPGVVLLVRTPAGRWNGAAGYADIETGERMTPSHLFHAASVTKTYLAAAVLLLAQDGSIDLDARISRYLPKAVYGRIPNGSRATVRQLLSHRSGIPDFSGATAYEFDFLNDPLGSYPPERLLSYLHGQSALFAPGAGYFYSNANYYILALIVDGLVRGGHAAVISRRILAPLGLHHTFYKDEPGYPTPPGLVDSYQDFAGDGQLMNVTDLAIHNDEVFMGNAGLMATSSDFADFLDGLLGGTLLAPESLSEMEAWSRPSRSGLGLNYLVTPYGPAVGHSGGDVGALAQVRYFPDLHATLVLLSNGGNSGVTATLFGHLWTDAMKAALEGLHSPARPGTATR